MPHIGFLSLSFHIPGAHSLKEKRQVIRSLKDRLRSAFNVSVAEIGEHDKWQRAVIGVCMISPDQVYIDQNLQQIVRLAEDLRGAELLHHQVEFI